MLINSLHKTGKCLFSSFMNNNHLFFRRTLIFVFSKMQEFQDHPLLLFSFNSGDENLV